MSIKDFVKAHCPSFLLPLLKAPYHVIKRLVCKIRLYITLYITKKKAVKYLPYYQDELSRGILSARLEYLRTGDNNIFMDIIEKLGMKFREFPILQEKAYPE